MRVDIDQLTAELDERLAAADAALAARFPGARPGRQPVHTVYVPADRVTSELAADWGEQALATLDEHEGLLRELLDDDADADDLVARVRTKLATEPVEDLRADFEDGYGARGDEVEDADVARVAKALAAVGPEETWPSLHGVRFKSLEAPTRARGVRTLAGFVTGYVEAGGDTGRLALTLPKVTSVDQVTAMVHACERLEEATGLAAGALGFEIQVETPQSILGPDGTALVARMVHAAGGRCTALHYGTYDYSAFCGIAAEYQSMEHPAADHAKLVMQAAAAGTGVRLSDGSTNVLPVGSLDQVRLGWQLHLRLVRRSLERGYYQGWDLHPAQLVTRFAATFGFYRAGLDAAGGRLRRYLEGSGSAVLDEPATARALADFLLRALDCGATTASELEALTGASVSHLAGQAHRTR